MRDRWSLKIGESVRLLPQIALESAPVHLFLHDSDHSVSHRRFEFTTIKPFMAPDGVILSDDDEPADGLLRGLAGVLEYGLHPASGRRLRLGCRQATGGSPKVSFPGVHPDGVCAAACLAQAVALTDTIAA